VAKLKKGKRKNKKLILGFVIGIIALVSLITFVWHMELIMQQCQQTSIVFRNGFVNDMDAVRTYHIWMYSSILSNIILFGYCIYTNREE